MGNTFECKNCSFNIFQVEVLQDEVSGIKADINQFELENAEVDNRHLTIMKQLEVTTNYPTTYCSI